MNTTTLGFRFDRPTRHARQALAVRNVALAALTMLGSCACNSTFQPEPGDLGGTSEDSTSADAEGPFDPADFMGAWSGHALDPLHPKSDGSPSVYVFPSGSSDIQLNLGLGGNFIIFGSGSPPPADDRDVGYPPDRNYALEPLVSSPWLPPVEGFEYSLLERSDVTSDLLLVDFPFPLDQRDGVVRLNYIQNEFATDWCRLQVPREAPQLDGSMDYVCVDKTAQGFGMSVGEAPECSVGGDPIDCGKLFMCVTSQVPVCRCSPTRCTINTDLRPTVQLRRQGEELVGVLGQGVFIGSDGQLTSLSEVHFRRAE